MLGGWLVGGRVAAGGGDAGEPCGVAGAEGSPEADGVRDATDPGAADGGAPTATGI